MKWFNNLKVGVKVLLASLVFVLIIVFVSLMGLTNANSANKNFQSLYADRLIPIRQLNRILLDLMQIRINMLQGQIGAEEGDWDEVNTRFEYSKELTASYSKEWEAYKGTELNEKEVQLVKEWEELAAEPKEAREKFNAALKAGNLEGSKVLLAEWLKGYNPLKEKTRELINVQQNVADQMKQQEEANALRTRNISLIILAISLAVTALVTWILARSVSNPVNKGLTFAQQIAEGDLTQRIDLDQKDELGQLGAALNKAADSLENLISNVTVASQNLAQAVDQIASGNQNLSQRTSEQASSLEEIASTIEETTATINQNADNANEAKKMADSSSQMADEGGRQVREAVTSINDINETSKKIEEIISVINDIAFQTNLLALNAAVEAARAGEQGRGFAVVAGEVRNLAQRSGNAAKEIGDLIKDSITKIEVGTEQANRSGEAINEIIASVQNVEKVISEIAAASTEQKQGVNQINIAVTEMDNMTQQNAALVEETASASEEMANQAQELLQMVQEFKVSDSLRSNLYEKKHRELHLTSNAGTGKKEEVAEKEQAKPSQPKKANAGSNLKDVLGDEGFEEF